MQTFSTNAINLKAYVLNETDKIVVMYSEDKGLMRCVAKGVKKPKSKLGGRMEMLVANKLLLRKGKNLDTVAQADTINSFYKIRQDMDKMMYAIYCAEIIINFGVENDPSAEEVYSLFYNCLQKIADSSSTVDVLLVVLRFQLQILQIVGYALELDGCANCSLCVDEEELYFSIL